MSQTHIDYADYTVWANNRLINALLKLDKDTFNQHIEASFPSLSATIKHIWMAETGWLARMQGKGWELAAVKNFSGDAQALCEAWQSTTLAFKDFVATTDLTQKVSFDHKGVNFEIPFSEVAFTVFNHGGYHRGQLVMMLRQLGVNDIPQTDYIEWVREKMRA